MEQILRNMASASASKFTSSRHRRTKSSPVQYWVLPDSEGFSDGLLRNASTAADVQPTCETGNDSGGLAHYLTICVVWLLVSPSIRPPALLERVVPTDRHAFVDCQ